MYFLKLQSVEVHMMVDLESGQCILLKCSFPVSNVYTVTGTVYILLRPNGVRGQCQQHYDVLYMSIYITGLGPK